MKALLIALLPLAACTTTGISPVSGSSSSQPALTSAPSFLGAKTFTYNCSDGTQLTARLKKEEAQVTLPTGAEILLPRAESKTGLYYQTEGYSLWPKGAGAIWTVGLKPSLICTTI